MIIIDRDGHAWHEHVMSKSPGRVLVGNEDGSSKGRPDSRAGRSHLGDLKLGALASIEHDKDGLLLVLVCVGVDDGANVGMLEEHVSACCPEEEPLKRSQILYVDRTGCEAEACRLHCLLHIA